MYRKWAPLHNVARIPEILEKYRGDWHLLYVRFIRHHGLTNEKVKQVIDEVFEARMIASSSTTAPPPPTTMSTMTTTPCKQEYSKEEPDDDDSKPDETETGTNPQPKGKKRRGKKRCRPGSSERRWAALEKAHRDAPTDKQFQ